MDTRASISFDTRVFNLLTIKAASIKFLDKASFDFSLDGHQVKVSIRFENPLNAEAFLADYRNEVLDQDLRAIISEETRPYRDIILANAFSRTSLIKE